ncbi:hypothetical protein VNO80_11962 [Phaseolus coccineus]|uniref:Uncharacterized protein n=1 Tax=Phaseolus coccineus TaxID=3886 RepID=A0AAN9NB43_PHACN
MAEQIQATSFWTFLPLNNVNKTVQVENVERINMLNKRNSEKERERELQVCLFSFSLHCTKIVWKIEANCPRRK